MKALTLVALLFVPFALPAADAAPLGPLVFAKYKGGAVAGGGSIQGTVTIAKIPELPEMPITKDVEVCEHARINPRLVVDAATKGVANVVVWIDGIEKGKKREKGKFVIDQKNCHYTPHVSIVPIKSNLAFGSSDPILHNVHVWGGTPEAPHSKTKDVLNLALKDANAPNAPFDRRSLRRPGFYFVQCDAGHPWMSAYVWVVEHPYYAKTDAQGKFTLTDVPPGTYTLRFWQEGWEAEPIEQDGKIVGFNYGDVRQHTAQVTVTAGQPATVNWEIPG